MGLNLKARKKCRVIAIAGPSGGGKSSLAMSLADRLGKEQCNILTLDNFYNDLSHLSPSRRAANNFDHPDALDVPLIHRTMHDLQHGNVAFIPHYDFQTHCRTKAVSTLTAKPFLIVEGVFAISLPGCETLEHLHLYLDVDAETCLQRRIERDVRERGRSEAEVRKQFEQSVLPSIKRHVAPQKSAAHLILDGSRPLSELVNEIMPFLENEETHMLPPFFSTLADRLGLDLLSQRLELQASHWAGFTHQGEGIFHLERYFSVDEIIAFILKISGFSRMGRSGAQDLQVEQNRIVHSCLPPALDGYRILQLSDLHLDLETGVLPKLTETLGTLDCDIAVITGDFRNSTRGDFSDAIERTAAVLAALKKPVFGILGNHDFIEMTGALEDAGMRLLLNEYVMIEHNGSHLLLGGIDDPHFYQTHDLAGAGARPAEPDLFRLLLSHSPEIYSEAAEGFDLMLSGHTHGGQICLPGGIALLNNGRCPRKLIAGAWQHGSMHGYTSRGTGCCGVAARFFCPPEITLHTLHCG